MKILILGGTRYAGIHLVNKLLSNNHEVTIATRGITPDPFGEKVTRIIIDRDNADSLSIVFKDEFYDIVIDNIAYSSIDVRTLLDVIKTNKYVMTSTVSVYHDFHMNMKEAEMDTKKISLEWCDRDDYTYDIVKRQAEASLFQAYADLPSVAVRFPWIFGTDDYTKRLFFYINNIINEKPMNINNPDACLSFINSVEAGEFLAWCAENPIYGYVNACSNGTISFNEIITYTEKNTGKKAIYCEEGEAAPLNDVPDFSLDTSFAKEMGYNFKNISDWVYPTIDYWLGK